MSVVTSVIVSIHCLEDYSCAWIDELNDWLEQNGHRPFQKEETGGGEKSLVCTLLIGAFNCLDVDAFAHYLVGLNWTSPDNVQMLVMESGKLDDRTWRVYLLPKKEAR